MKTTLLFQLGGIAVLLSAILTGIGNLIYFLSGQPDLETAPLIWRGIFAGALMVLGLGALFARQSQRGGILGLVGYVLLVCATIFFVASDAVALGMSAGVISDEQISQVPSYVLSSSIMPWIWVAGLLAFGISIYRAQVFPKYAGALLILLGLIQPLTGPLAFTRPIYAVCYFVAWAWLGWELYSKAGDQKDELQIAQQGAAANASR
jgi:preprotein translocase subunit SecY